ncbi:hypothetical protein [Falsiroseomonas sp. CW058]|uniref:hypothetical protein n=1 Tax=Falsiroseomonas sp. CW058 TaxID=3388664 RepID=UPI003D31DE07
MDPDVIVEADTKLVFFVQGSQPEPYRCEFVRARGRLSGRCSCPAGEAEQACKHRLALLRGDGAAVVGGKSEDLRCLATMLDGTSLQNALREAEVAESELSAAKKKLSNAKHRLSRIMHEIH